MPTSEFLLELIKVLASGVFALGGIFFGLKWQSADRKAAKADKMRSLLRNKAQALFQEIEAFRISSNKSATHFALVALALELDLDQPEAPENTEGSYASIKALTLMYFQHLKPIITKYEEDKQQQSDNLTNLMKEKMLKPHGTQTIAAASALSMQVNSQLCDDLELALVKEIEGLVPSDKDRG